MKKAKLGFLGFGNMAEAIVAGILKSQQLKADQILVSDIDIKKLKSAQKKYKIQLAKNNNELFNNCQYLLIAIKPYQISSVLKELTLTTRKTAPVIISIAAGTSRKTLKKYFKNSEVIRVMPNTPLQVGQGMTGLLFPKNLSKAQIKFVKGLFDCSGKTLIVKSEKKLDALTAVSGSGPAFVYNFALSYQKAAQKLGFSQEEASKLVLQTLLGAQSMLEKNMLQKNPDTQALIQQVTSKKGTTEAGLKQMQKLKIDQVMLKTLDAAYQRALEISQED